MRIFFLVLARDASNVEKKAIEISNLGFPYLVVCGEKTDHSNVVYRQPKGKFDAMNFGFHFVPPDTDIVAFNDVDTEIHNFQAAQDAFQSGNFSMVFARVDVKRGPQLTFYSFLDSLRKRVQIAASGELILVKFELLKKIMPLKPCKAEDSYIQFEVLRRGAKVAFCEKCFVTTKRTEAARQEEAYKRRTVAGIYQALSLSKPPITIRLFYLFLPVFSPLLMVLGKKGYYWSRGILLGFLDYIKGDRTGVWKATYG